MSRGVGDIILDGRGHFTFLPKVFLMRGQQNTVGPNRGQMRAKSLLKAPPLFLEYAFYAVVVNNLFNLVRIPFFEIVGYSSIAALCLIHFGKLAIPVCRPIALALGCAISTVLVQLVIHEESLFGPTQIRNFIVWAVCLVVVQSLCVRKGFFHRFAIFAFFVGLGTLPFMVTHGSSEVTRLTLEKGTGLGTANGLAMWFGFCFIYFLIAGLEAKNYLVRSASWAGGLISFFIMGWTVSRAPLLGSAMAGVLAFKKVLRRSYLPILGFLVVCWIVYLLGLADNIIAYYLARGAVDTGRTFVFTAAVERFLDSWWAGVGLSNATILRPGHVVPTATHNSFLFIGLSSGVVPLAFFIGYIWYAARGAFQSHKEKSGNSPFLLPMFLFGVFEMMILTYPFLSPWFMVVLATIFSERNYPHLGQITGNKTSLQGEIHGPPLSSLTKLSRSQKDTF